ncbi:hypothetical protein CYB_1681 [Synechococcus sp. JA-2-3B'a(2-13)]|nr:hypothetical protein CYB_1681 [Synechococcus sp. JA-2-3B'a(2-13)]
MLGFLLRYSFSSTPEKRGGWTLPINLDPRAAYLLTGG